MARVKVRYQCSECGAESPKWVGRCPDCGAWNTLTEMAATVSHPARGGYAGAAGRGVQTLSEVTPERTERTRLGIEELDRVLGGGLVPGSVILLGGDPGIGKSTLLLQALMALADRHRTLYVTGEESPEQVALRAARLRLSGERLRIAAETSVEAILAMAQAERPQVLVVDSIQTLFTEEVGSAPGSVSQVRESAARLVRHAKATGTALFLVGHVTKEGALAGPRVLEHMVDTVLYFEGDAGGRYRIVRAIKNRFGAVNEIGVFVMTDTGLKAVSNPSAIFLSRHEQPVPGSVVMVTREGTRPLLVEVQALVDDSQLGNPRRVTLGLEQNRLAMLLAVLHRHGGIAVSDQDVFVNVVGGVRVTETAADVPVLLSVLSSFRNRALPHELFAFGEVGLAGEVRPVPGGQERIREAAKHGFRRALVPAANLTRGFRVEGMELLSVRRLDEVVGQASELLL